MRFLHHPPPRDDFPSRTALSVSPGAAPQPERSETPRPSAAPPVPDGMPEPRPYGHLGPEDGACLMETASLLGAGPFTDSPRGTDPALAALARSVNDSVGDRARVALRPLAADLADARPADRGFAPRLIADVLHAAREAAPAARGLAAREARCRARARRVSASPGGRTAAARDTVWWRGPGRHHLEHALRVLLRAPDAERRLVAVLHDAVGAARRATAGGAGPVASENPPRPSSPSATVG
ncbi:hypothetical protein RM572_00165 [Streptomyces sp. DSM 42041]|uniref:Uncharacterized protein n=1 Tax=Streptomyces hazeniae TaxID=3075538 RepID=A0ABU2NMB6_9ACTN|nr:hypothetical protein [Streptomyces sp. DSM 42041]MDT0377192.1 hypothetical protein [Streptomyces sp. DSM 42041]